MKKQAITLSVLTIAAMPAYAALDCAVPPTCEELGYSDLITNCPSKYVKCPFDTTKGRCINDATVGQISYFPSNPGGLWLPCNGSSFNKANYPLLANILPAESPYLPHFTTPDWSSHDAPDGTSAYIYTGGVVSIPTTNIETCSVGKPLLDNHTCGLGTSVAGAIGRVTAIDSLTGGPGKAVSYVYGGRTTNLRSTAMNNCSSIGGMLAAKTDVYPIEGMLPAPVTNSSTGTVVLDIPTTYPAYTFYSDKCTGGYEQCASATSCSCVNTTLASTTSIRYYCVNYVVFPSTGTGATPGTGDTVGVVITPDMNEAFNPTLGITP